MFIPAVGYALTFLLHVRVPAIGYALLPAVGPLFIVESCGSSFALRLLQSLLLMKVIARYSPSIPLFSSMMLGSLKKRCPISPTIPSGLRNHEYQRHSVSVVLPRYTVSTSIVLIGELSHVLADHRGATNVCVLLGNRAHLCCCIDS